MGSNIAIMDKKEHDKIFAITSHLASFNSI